jgi:hypothetical protein
MVEESSSSPGSEWTVARIEERLSEAADVMRRLPQVKVQGYFSTWPAIFHDFADRIGREPSRLKRPPPAPDAITRAEDALLWLRWLEVDESRLVWMRAEGARWREICQRFGIARATAHRRYAYALAVIMWRLERRSLPKSWSREYFIERVRVPAKGSEAPRKVSH